MLKVLKKQKGFTLVELLAVIVILGLIAAIAVPAIGNIIEKSRQDALRESLNMIESAAHLYIVNENVTLPATGSSSNLVTLTDLLNGGYLIEQPKIPGSNTDLAVTITVDSTGKITVAQAAGN